MKEVILLINILLLSALSLPAQEAKFEVKSAILEKETIMAGQKVENILYINEYGKKGI
jgi:hypothetical protein